MKDKKNKNYTDTLLSTDERESRDIEALRKEDRRKADKQYREMIVNRGYLSTL